ncbi:MAG: hypothetical protein K6G66_01225, partial [Oscillospiraceae bacterium]|nr:hypothetical protein [Oscillospiraceae bacterium]
HTPLGLIGHRVPALTGNAPVGVFSRGVVFLRVFDYITSHGASATQAEQKLAEKILNCSVWRQASRRRFAAIPRERRG